MSARLFFPQSECKSQLSWKTDKNSPYGLDCQIRVPSHIRQFPAGFHVLIMHLKNAKSECDCTIAGQVYYKTQAKAHQLFAVTPATYINAEKW
jgi:YHS domain-containing protein